TLVARRRAARMARGGQAVTWQRDQSSRDYGS
ncbi:MAG: hypothetical protein JWR42_2293, partial [Marmoricola sp.]|nr:hypothetical protein [Marmoricola sp.]